MGSGRLGNPNPPVNLAGYIFAISAKDRQTFFFAGLDGALGLIVKLDGPAAARAVVGGRAMVDQAVEEETATRLERYRHDRLLAVVIVADLPVAALKVNDWPLAVGARVDNHTAV